MVFGLYNINLGKTQASANQYANMGVARIAAPSNMWGTYFASFKQDKQSATTNPYDAMAKLNNYYSSQQVNTTEQTGDIEAQEVEDVQKAEKPKPVDPKVGIAKGKLGELTSALSKSDFPKVTERLDSSLKLLAANPELSYLTSDFKDKLSGAATKFGSLVTMGMASIKDQNLTASELNQIIDKIKDEYKQLQADWKKVVIGYTKAGAYSEAMLLVNSDKNKDKYQKGAIEAVANLPDFKADANSVQNTQQTDAADNNQETDAENEDFAADEISDFTQYTDVQVDTSIIADTEVSTNPIEADSEITDKPSDEIQNDTQSNEVDKEVDETDNSMIEETSDEELNADDNELTKLKSEIKEDLQKEKVQNPEQKRITVDTIDGKKSLKSVLFS